MIPPTPHPSSRPVQRLALAVLSACAVGAVPGVSGAEVPADPVPIPGPWEADGLHPAEPLPEALRAASLAVHRGQGPRALAALETIDPEVLETPAGRLLRAEALRLAGRCEDAAPAYEAVLLQSPRLTDQVRLHLAECFVSLGRPADAAAVLADVRRDSRHHPAARLLRARALLEADEPAAAREALTDLSAHAAGTEAAEAFLLRGRAALATGDAETALADLLRGILAAPSHVFAREAGALASGIFEEDEILGAAWSLLAGALGRPNTHVRLARLSRDSRSRPLAPIVAAARGRVEADAGRHVAALALFSEAATSADPDLAARARFDAAVSAQALGRLRVARRTYEAVAADHPGHALAATARLEAARLALRARDHAEAAELLKALLLAQPVGPERPQALFLLGWSLLRQDEPAEAAGFFAAAAAEAPAEAAFEDVYGGTAIASGARALYWTGRAYGLAGRAEEAEASFRQVLARYPLSYYAGLSRAQLAGAGTQALESAAAASGAALDPRVVRAREALDLGWRQQAARELGPVMLRPAETDGRSILAAAMLLEEMGRIGAARGLYRAAVLHGSADLPPAEREAAWRFAFPRRYAELIEREAGRWGYSPWLLYGLVLRESGFAPCAKSSAGAVGLAQLMMSAAGDAAADLGLPPPTEERLCDPEYNLRLGAWHLRKLLRRYDGSEILALAAYNAGPGSVNRWLERAEDLPLDAFVEEIPFEETRAYVRLVISAARGYAITWGEPGGEELGVRIGPAPNEDDEELGVRIGPAPDEDDEAAGPTFTSGGH